MADQFSPSSRHRRAFALAASTKACVRHQAAPPVRCWVISQAPAVTSGSPSRHRGDLDGLVNLEPGGWSSCRGDGCSWPPLPAPGRQRRSVVLPEIAPNRDPDHRGGLRRHLYVVNYGIQTNDHPGRSRLISLIPPPGQLPYQPIVIHQLLPIRQHPGGGATATASMFWSPAFTEISVNTIFSTVALGEYRRRPAGLRPGYVALQSSSSHCRPKFLFHRFPTTNTARFPFSCREITGGGP